MRRFVFSNPSTVTEEDEAQIIQAAACRRAQQITLTGSIMSLMVMLLVASLVTQCWSAPQRRNWTPQAILYLKGAQGHRSVLERVSREDGDTLDTPERHLQSSDGPGSSWSSLLLELLQRAVEEGGNNPDSYPDAQQLNLSYF